MVILVVESRGSGAAALVVPSIRQRGILNDRVFAIGPLSTASRALLMTAVTVSLLFRLSLAMAVLVGRNIFA